jgi:hypothetical protein
MKLFPPSKQIDIVLLYMFGAIAVLVIMLVVAIVIT